MVAATTTLPISTIAMPVSNGRYSATRANAKPATNNMTMAMALDTRMASATSSMKMNGSATGNVATEDVAYMLERSGIATGLALPAAVDAAHWLAGVMDRPLPAMVSRAPAFPG